MTITRSRALPGFWAPCALTVGLCLLASAAAAQPLFKHVDANGRVSYSDRPPAAGQASQSRGLGSVAASTASPTSSGSVNFPYALRQTMQRFPVALYTREGCEPCALGRTLLHTRGIPFQELTVNSEQDSAALQRLSGDNTLPLLTVGSQHIKGFADVDWSRYLDAAGYPSSVPLPAGYQPSPARPLVAGSAAPAQPSSAGAEPTASPARRVLAPPPPAVGPTPDNPAGIRF